MLFPCLFGVGKIITVDGNVDVNQQATPDTLSGD